MANYNSSYTGSQIDNAVGKVVANAGTAGQVLTADGSGGSSWQTPSEGSQVSGTNDGTNWTSITIDGNTKNILGLKSYMLRIESSSYVADIYFLSTKTLRTTNFSDFVTDCVSQFGSMYQTYPVSGYVRNKSTPFNYPAINFYQFNNPLIFRVSFFSDTSGEFADFKLSNVTNFSLSVYQV